MKMSTNNFLKKYDEFMKSVDADIYVNAHTTSPFAKVESVNTCIEKVENGIYDSAFCAESIKSFWLKDKKPFFH